jgi:FKBP-type peptidyl-prolyl cis-trans isomerase
MSLAASAHPVSFRPNSVRARLERDCAEKEENGKRDAMSRSSLVLLLVLALPSSCQSQKPADSPANAEQATAPPPEATKPKPDDLGPMLPGVERQDVVVGSGPPAKKGDRVSVHYSGFLLDGTKFDSSVDRGVPFEFVIGEHQVIEGWENGVTGMKKGGKRKLKIPPHLAYGLTGSPPKIGPDATLLFDIELLDILPAGG